MAEREDREIIEAVLSGAIDDFEEIVRRHERMVFSITGRHVPAGRVEEIAQDAFLRAFQSLKNWRPEKPFAHWLARIALRACHDFWRKEGRRREIPVSVFSAENEEWVEDVLSRRSSEDFQDREDAKAAQELLDWALALIDPADRLALTLVHLEGYSVSQTAEMLKMSVANVKVRNFRASRRLRKALEELTERDKRLQNKSEVRSQK
jgi:RNA polymerase sigma-70 factor (ECF subfamily)